MRHIAGLQLPACHSSQLTFMPCPEPVKHKLLWMRLQTLHLAS